MSLSGFKLEGAEHMMKIFREFPEVGYRKPIMEGLKAAALPVRKAMSSAIPAQIKPTRRILKIKSARKALVVTVGFQYGFGMYKSRKGVVWDAYQLVYWFNYGTYANRSPGHQFKKARRKISMDRKGGIRPALFVEGAWERSKDSAVTELQKNWTKQMAIISDKYGATQ